MYARPGLPNWRLTHGFDRGPLSFVRQLYPLAAKGRKQCPLIYVHAFFKASNEPCSKEKRKQRALSCGLGNITGAARWCIGTFPSPEQGYDPCLNNSSHLRVYFYLCVLSFSRYAPLLLRSKRAFGAVPRDPARVKTRERIHSSNAPFKRRETRIPEQCAFYYRARFQGPSTRNVHAHTAVTYSLRK